MNKDVFKQYQDTRSGSRCSANAASRVVRSLLINAEHIIRKICMLQGRTVNSCVAVRWLGQETIFKLVFELSHFRNFTGTVGGLLLVSALTMLPALVGDGAVRANVSICITTTARISLQLGKVLGTRAPLDASRGASLPRTLPAGLSVRDVLLGDAGDEPGRLSPLWAYLSENLPRNQEHGDRHSNPEPAEVA